MSTLPPQLINQLLSSIPTKQVQTVPVGSVSMPAYTKAGPYVTSLHPEVEQKFQIWVKDNKIPWKDAPNADYDMRGYYNAMIAGDPNAKRATNLHFPDTYKTPYHKSFSNESIYATADAPYWKGNKLIDKTGNVIFDEDKEKR